MDKTTCYSYFCIDSAGEIRDGVGFVAAENSFFDPKDITSLLGIEPEKTRLMGAPRPNGDGAYPFSSWCACRRDEPALDAGEQCLAIVRRLGGVVPLLRQIGRTYNVDFGIMVVPVVENGDAPALYFEREVIDFCHQVNASIQIDLYANPYSEDE